MVCPPFFDKAPSIINKVTKLIDYTYVLCMQFVIKNYFLQPDGSVLFECMLNGNPQPEVNYCLC